MHHCLLKVGDHRVHERDATAREGWAAWAAVELEVQDVAPAGVCGGSTGYGGNEAAVH